MSAPANDDLANRIPLTVGPQVVVAIADATLEGTDETDIFSTDYDRSVWYEFTPSHDGTYGLETFFGDIFGAVHWWCTGTSYGDLTILHGPTYGGSVSHDLTGGQTYLLRVARDVTNGPVAEVTLQLREYRWTDWIDQDEEVAPCTRNVGWRGLNDFPDEFHFEFPIDDPDDIAAIINDGLTDQHAALLGMHLGTDDSWFADQTVSPGTGAVLGESAGNAWIFNVKVGTNGDLLNLKRTITVRSHHSMEQMSVRPSTLGSWIDQPGIRFEQDFATVTSATLLMGVHAQNESLRDHTENFGCNFTALVYLPGLDGYIPEQPHTETVIYGPAAIPADRTTPLTDSFTLELSEADLVGMKVGSLNFSTVIFGVLIEPTAPTDASYGTNDEWDEGYNAGLDIDWENSSFTIQPPRFQLRELIDASSVAPPRRLHPRDDGLGIGIGRVFPPPTTQQAGRRSGPGAPY